MATGYKYKDTDIACFTAKSSGENLDSKVDYIDLNDTDYKSSLMIENGDGTQFIKKSSSLLDGLWADLLVEYKDVYTSSSSNPKISDAAAWGTAPIPKRYGLNNTASSLISKHEFSIAANSEISFKWGTSTDTNGNSRTGIHYSTTGITNAFITAASCVVVDLVAAGGNGGMGYARDAYMTGGGGGGSGAHASILINFNKYGLSNTIYLTDTGTALVVKNNSKSTFLTLNKGAAGSNGGYSNPGTGGAGGQATPGSAPTGVKILWTSTGAAGGTGDKGIAQGFGSGTNGADSPTSIDFFKTNVIKAYAGGRAYSEGDSLTVGGGGGGSSIFAHGGKGGHSDGELSDFHGKHGSGGGGGYVMPADKVLGGTTVSGRNGTGGSAAACFYFESTYSGNVTPVEISLPTEPSYYAAPGYESSNLGCVFPGTQIFLDKDTSVDITEFHKGTPIDFCNPDTLEHFPQQTLATLYSEKATKKITLWLEDGKSIALTPDHVVLTKEGFKTYLKNNTYPKYEIGEELATVDGYKAIISIQEENIDATTVYNIITENSLMVANGIIVAGELNYGIELAALDYDDNINKDLHT